MNIYVAHSLKDDLFDPCTELQYDPELTYEDFEHNLYSICYPAIEKCDAIVGIPDATSGKFTHGVRRELKWAGLNGIPVIA